MFAAAAIVAQMAYDGALFLARWIATRLFFLALITTVLPWVLKGVYVWGFDYLMTFIKTSSSFVFDSISTYTQGSYDFDVTLTSVGGFLAVQTGFIDYCSIIITGWGIYWFIAIFPRRLPGL